METMLESVAQFMESMSGCDLVIGTNFFVGYLPQKTHTGVIVPDRLVVILDAGGVPENQLPDWVNPAVFQIWNRAKDYYEANEDSWCIYEALTGTSGWQLPSIGGGPQFDALTVDAVNKPYPIGNPNEENYFVFSVNYQWSISNAS